MFENIGLAHWVTVVVALLLAISEILPFSEKIKANGIFQAFVNIAKAIKGEPKPPIPPAV